MAHFVVTCPEVPGHENSMVSLALELQNRGHVVSWLGGLDGAERAVSRGFQSLVVGKKEFPLGFMPKTMAEMGKTSGLAGVRFAIEVFRQAIEVGLREVPAAISECGADAIIADESIFSARTLAEVTELPWITICSALPIHPDMNAPPSALGWGYRNSIFYRLRNRAAFGMFQFMMRPIHREINRFRTQHDMPHTNMFENASTLATIAQITKEFDFPRREEPDWLHYVGSFQRAETRREIEFPWHQLDERPIVYASMGTLQNRLLPVFQKIAEACNRDDVQLVISLGGGGEPSDVSPLVGDPLVVSFAPQLELIERASLVITHAGMNTVTECIAAGKPMLAIPVTSDQPGVAARVKRAGCGEVVSIARLSVKRIRRALDKLLSDDNYALKAQKFAALNKNAGGVTKAANIIESAIQ